MKDKMQLKDAAKYCFSSGKLEFDGWMTGADSRGSTQIGKVRNGKEGVAEWSSRIKRNPVKRPLCTV